MLLNISHRKVSALNHQLIQARHHYQHLLVVLIARFPVFFVY